MQTLILYALCTPSLFYLGSRATITSWLWSRYPAIIARWADCAACSGAWYGALVAYFGGFHGGRSFLGLPGGTVSTLFVVAFASMTWTPIIAGLVQRGFDTLGSVIDEPEPEPESKDDGEGR